MGMQQIREAFNRALGDVGSCIRAHLDYTREDGKQVQLITLFGNWADGEAFTAQTPTHDMSSDGQAEVAALGLQMRNQARVKEPAAAPRGATIETAAGPSPSNLGVSSEPGSVSEPSPAVERRPPAAMGGGSKPGDVLTNPFMGL